MKRRTTGSLSHRSCWRLGLALAALLTCATASAADDAWVRVAGNDEAEFFLRKGSLEPNRTDRTNEPVISAVGRMVEVKAKGSPTDFRKFYVTLADCQRGYGEIVTTTLEGRFRFKNEFVKDGGTIASTVADTLCRLAEGAGYYGTGLAQ